MTDVEPGKVAIVGMAIRVPGAERDLDLFWENIRSGTDSVSFFSRDEMIGWGVPEELVDQPNFVRARAVLQGSECFDGRLFGYSPSDSALMDPQQRILLECAWSALEHAGYAPIAADGNRIGVYAGTGMNVYLLDYLMPNERALKAAGGLQLVISSEKDYAANRIGYKLNLQGPAFTVQSACSTSLVAIHLAVQSLLTYDADMALAGAATISPPTRRGHLHEPGGIFSSDGRCKTFDIESDGTVPGDGAGMVVLKRLEDALRDNDTIHAVIAGSAVNNDGARKAGFTAPGPTGQAAVISAALGVAGIDPDDIGLIETHGTATRLGDPVEIAALAKVFGSSRADRIPCALAALKSIVGHLDTASGVVGVIKTALALQHQTVPPVAHFTAANPAINLDDLPFFVPAQAQPWEPINGVRRAGVSAFGIGGTNAHVILEEAPSRKPAPLRRFNDELILVSARTAQSAEENLGLVTDFVEAAPSNEIADIAFTLRTGRTALPWRAAFVAGSTKAHAARQVDNRLRGQGIAFIYTGDGELNGNRSNYDADPVYRAIVDQAVALLRPLGELTADQRDQSTRFVTAVALTASLRSRGISPAAVHGTGVGAIAARCAADELSIQDGLRASLATVAPEPIAHQETIYIAIGTNVTLHGTSDDPAQAPAEGHSRLLAVVGSLWEIGIGDPWDARHDSGRQRLPLPTYPFAPTRHYFERQS